MVQFPTGKLLVSISVVADAHGLPVHAQRIYGFVDQGRTWAYRYMVSEAMMSVKIPRPNGDVLMIPDHVNPDPPGRSRTFSGSYVHYQSGGKQIVIEAQGLRVERLPRDIRPTADAYVLPGTVNQGVHCFEGDGIEVEGRLLTTMYLILATARQSWVSWTKSLSTRPASVIHSCLVPRFGASST